jgi:hypothetical protein
VRRIIGPAVVAMGLILLWPGAAHAADFVTHVTCEATGTCSSPQTTPASGAGRISIAAGGSPAANSQVFVVQEHPGVQITDIKAFYSDGTVEDRDPGERTHVITPVSEARFVERFEVHFNDTAAATTTTTAPGATTTTTVAPTTTTTAPTTTTTTTVPRGPGFGPIAVRADGSVQSSPDAAALHGFEFVDVVVRGTDNGLYLTQWDGSSWSGWRGLGGPPGGGVRGDPAVVRTSTTRIDAFVRGADDKLWQITSTDGGASWGAWFKAVGDEGVLASGPDVSSRGEGRFDVFVAGTDGQVYQRFYENGWNHAWLPHGAPGANLGSGPTTVSWDSVRVDVFVRGADSRLWHRGWDGSSWSSWAHTVGSDPEVRSGPDATSWGSGHLAVYVRGPGDALYRLQFNGTWGQWVRMGGPGDVVNNDTGPGVTSRGLGRLDAFVRGTDNLLYQFWE